MAVRVTVYGTANMKQITAARAELDRLEKTALKNATGFQASMAKLSASATNAGQRMSDVGSSMTRNVTLPLAAVGAGLYKATQAAADDAQAQVVLANTLQKTAGATTQQIAATESWITAQGKALGVADDQLRPALGALATATGDVAKAQQLAGLAMDIAAQKGVPVETAANALAKAYAGQTTSLARMLPGIDKAALASGNFADVQAAVAAITGGAAAKAADTEAGARQRANVALQESIESLGTAFLPIMTQVTDLLRNDVVPAITSVSDWFTSLDESTRGNIIKFGLFVAAAGPVISVLGSLTSGAGAAAGAIAWMTKTMVATAAFQNFRTGLTHAAAGSSAFATPMMRLGGAIRTAALATKGFIVDLARQAAAMAASAARAVAANVAMAAQKAVMLAGAAATGIATAAQWALNAAMTANPIGIVVVAIGALIAGLVLLFKNNETVRNAFTKGWEAIKSAVAAVFNWVKSNWPLLLGILTGPIGLAVVMIAKNWDKIKEGASNAIAAVTDWFRGLPDRISSAVGNLGRLLLQAGKDLLSGLWQGIQNGWNWLKEKVSSLGGWILDTVKDKLGIASPSREFAKVGNEISNGVAVGIQQNAAVAKKAALIMAQDVTKAAQTGLAAVKVLADSGAGLGDDAATRSYQAMAAAYDRNAQDLKKLVSTTESELNNLESAYGSSGSAIADSVDKTADKIEKANDRIEAAWLAQKEAIKAAKQAAIEATWETLKSLKSQLDSIRQEVKDYAQGLQQSLKSVLSFSNAAQESGAATGKTFMESLIDQVNKARNFSAKIAQLVKLGLSQAGIEQIAAAGADAGTKIADEILAGGAAAIAQVNGLLVEMDKVTAVAADLAAGKVFGSAIKDAEQALADSRFAGVMNGTITVGPETWQNIYDAASPDLKDIVGPGTIPGGVVMPSGPAATGPYLPPSYYEAQQTSVNVQAGAVQITFNGSTTNVEAEEIVNQAFSALARELRSA